MDEHPFASALTQEMIGAQRDFNRALERQMDYIRAHPLPPLTRWQKFKYRTRDRQQALRTRVARRIAPWLDEY